ncbi:hypothetical protein, partial [Stieleria sp.]|uniref:hypothetical protein n=1 Tax=Stieleria sp. TaxID=2795976 RepID=UPI003566A457
MKLQLTGLTAAIDRSQFGWTKENPNQIPAVGGEASGDSLDDPSVPAAAPPVSDQVTLLDGLSQFATWTENLGTAIGAEIEDVIPLPFISTGLQSLWASTGIGTTVSNTIRQHVENVFASPNDISYVDFLSVDSALQDVLHVNLAPSNMLTEFEANVELTSTGICFGGTAPSCTDINLDFLKDLGLDLTSFVSLDMPTQLDLEAAIDLRFGFGIDPLSDEFYVEDPTLVARLTVDHDEPLNVSMMVGPKAPPPNDDQVVGGIGVGIDDGTIFFQAGMVLPTEGRFGVADLAGGLSIGSPRFDPQSSYKIDLPFKLQGALAGLIDEVGNINGSLNYAEPGQLRNPALAVENLSAVQFFQMIPDTLNFEGPNFDALENLTKISLDQALVGIEDILRGAIASDGIAYQPLPFINQSAVDLLGEGAVNVVDAIANGIQTVRGELSDINRFEIDLNQAINSTLKLGLNIGGEEVDVAYDNIVALSTSLTAQSTDDDLAIALAVKNHRTGFDSLILDREVVAASDRLATEGLTGDSTDEQIATVLADPTLLPSTITLRDLVASDPVFSDAWNALGQFGFDGSTTDAVIDSLFDATEIIDLAIENRDVLLDVAATDEEKQFARILFARIGVAPDATDTEINDTFARAAEVAQVKADRDIVSGSSLVLQDAAAQLRSLGLNGDSTDLGVATALVGVEVVELWKADRDFVASFVSGYAEANPGTTLTTAETIALSRTHLQARMPYPATTMLSGDSTDAEVARSLVDPAIFDARIADRDILARYDANKSIDLEYGESVLDFDFSMAKAFGGNYDLAFDLEDLPGLGDVLTGDEGIGLDLDTDGRVFVDADINFDLNFTFDLSEIGNPSFVIYDDSQITFNKFVVETLAPIDVTGSITLNGDPVLSLAIIDATVNADLVGQISLTEDSEDHFHKVSDLAGDSSLWNVDLVGSVNADLPFYFPTASFPLGGSASDLDSDGIPDNVLHVDGTFTGPNDYDLNFTTPRLNFAKLFDIFALLNDPRAIIDGLDAFFDATETGIREYLQPLELPLIGDALQDAPAFLTDLKTDLLGDASAVSFTVGGVDVGEDTITVSGGTLADGDIVVYMHEGDAGTEILGLVHNTPYFVTVISADTIKLSLDDPTLPRPPESPLEFIDLTSQGTGTHTLDQPSGILGRLYDGVARNQSTVDLLREEIFNAFCNGTGECLLKTPVYDAGGDFIGVTPVTGADDIQLVFDDDFIQFNLLLGGDIFNEAVDLDFEGAIPGLGLGFESDAKIRAKLDYLLSFGFGFSKSDGMYLDTSGVTPTGEEFSLGLEVTLTDDVTNPASVAATLGFIKLQLTDVVPKIMVDGVLVDNPDDDGKKTGLFGSFDIDLIDKGNDGRMTLIGPGGFEGMDVEVRLTAEADLDVYASLELGAGAQFPDLSTTIHYDQTFAQAKLSTASGATATFGGSPRFVLENVSLDLGTFISDFAGPVLD